MPVLELKVGRKPVRAYITAAVVHFKNGGTDINVQARGRSISKAVDIAEILKRFEDPIMTVESIDIGTEIFVEKFPEEDNKESRERKVSTITIVMKSVKVK